MRCLVLALALLLGGCLGPNYERIADDLRTRNLQLEESLARVRQESTDREDTITLLLEQLDAKSPRVPTLSDARLAELFVVDRVELQDSTDAWDFDGKGKQEGFRVFFRPLMADGDVLPATGTVTIEAFDLALEQGSQRLGKWVFQPTELKDKWYGSFGLNHFAVNCPWTAPPKHAQITFKLVFVDALTGQVHEDQRVVTVHLREAHRV